MEKLDNALESALQEHEADLGIRFFHESDFASDYRLIRISLEDGKYSLRHGGGCVRRAFSHAGVIASWEEAFSEAQTEYSEMRLVESIVRDFVELARASLPLEGWLRASCWIVATWLGIEAAVEGISYLDTMALHRVEVRLAGRPLHVDVESSFPDRASSTRVRDLFASEFKALLMEPRRRG